MSFNLEFIDVSSCPHYTNYKNNYQYEEGSSSQCEECDSGISNCRFCPRCGYTGCVRNDHINKHCAYGGKYSDECAVSMGKIGPKIYCHICQKELRK